MINFIRLLVWTILTDYASGNNRGYENNIFYFCVKFY